MKALAVLLMCMFITNVEATYPLGTGRGGGNNAGVYWPDKNAHVLTREWVRDFEICRDRAYNEINGFYHSTYSDAETYRYAQQNYQVEVAFKNLYLECIHRKGYTEIEY